MYDVDNYVQLLYIYLLSFPPPILILQLVQRGEIINQLYALCIKLYPSIRPYLSSFFPLKPPGPCLRLQSYPPISTVCHQDLGKTPVRLYSRLVWLLPFFLGRRFSDRGLISRILSLGPVIEYTEVRSCMNGITGAILLFWHNENNKNNTIHARAVDVLPGQGISYHIISYILVWIYIIIPQQPQ